MIDWHRVGELREEVGPEDFDEVVDLFLEEVEEVIDQLRSPVDPDQVQGKLPFLKGSALSLGFQTFSQECQAGETRSESGQAADVDLLNIVEIYQQSKTYFVQELPGRFDN